jgi:hypothetical protein
VGGDRKVRYITRTGTESFALYRTERDAAEAPMTAPKTRMNAGGTEMAGTTMRY